VAASSAAWGWPIDAISPTPSPIRLQRIEAATHWNKPNIVWIMAEDISTELSCYGHPAVRTPNLDQLAQEGVLYTNVFTTAPSCAPSRSAMITSVYQTRIGAQDQRMRDRWSKCKNRMLPKPYRMITDYLREAGYFTALGCGYSRKTDFNFDTKTKPFDGSDWSQRKPGQGSRGAGSQLFFAQITLPVTHRGGHWRGIHKQLDNPVDPAKVELPPYYPDHPVCRQDWATYLDTIQVMDSQVGDILNRLDNESLKDNTMVIFIGDNGRCHVRGKCWLYDPGIRVPMIIRWPGKLKATTVCDDLISTIDISATVLKMAGIEPPENMDGRIFLGPNVRKRQYIFAARDRIDEAVDCIRCVRSKRYKYIRNYMPEKPRTQKFAYIEAHRPMLHVMKELYAKGQLTSEQALFMAPQKPEEELFDLENDPHEIHNLANSPGYQHILDNMRAALDKWIKETADTGLPCKKRSTKHDHKPTLNKHRILT